MIEFGAKLSLKDNMAATLKRNIDLQQQFSKQIEQTNSRVKELGKTKVNTTITANDEATDIIETVRESINQANNMTATSEITAEDNASDVTEAIIASMDALNGIKASPEVEATDKATPILSRITNALNSVGKVKIAPKAEIDDKATEQADKIAKKIKEIGALAVSPIIRIKDAASSQITNVSHKLKEIAATYTPTVKIMDLASIGLAKIKTTLGWLGSMVAKPAISVKDTATTIINKIRVAISTISKLSVMAKVGIQDTATKIISKIQSSLKSVAQTVTKPILQVKDAASPIVDKLKNSLKTVAGTTAKAALAVKDTATAVLDKVKSGLKGFGDISVKAVVGIKDAATEGLSKIKSLLSTLAKGVTIAVGIGGAGLAAIMGGSVSEGAKLEQSIGGVETLFKGDADKVIQNAYKAYETAGVSANSYMEQVTSFSASLLNSLSGDTAKATTIADQAIIDMADNANKFGTNIENIQSAYQGFAKQNYTMLDNLKLGYGGTKTEMERLLTDAKAISGADYSIDSLADIYEAIHVIQENLDVAGTTSKEAASTFSGSFSAMKAAAQNLLGNMAIGGDVTGSMSQLLEKASTFLFDNAIPMFGNVISALPQAVAAAAPKIKEGATQIVNSIKEALTSMLPEGMGEALFSSIDNAISAFSPVIGEFTDMLSRVAPIITETWSGALGNGGNLFETLASVVSSVIPIIESLILGLNGIFATFGEAITPIGETLSTVFTAAIPIVQGIIAGLATFIQGIMPVISSAFQVAGGIIANILTVIGNHMGLFQTIVSVAVAVITTVWNTLAPAISAVVNLILSILDLMLTGIEGVFNVLSPFISAAWAVISAVFTTASGVISGVVNALCNVFNLLSDVVNTVFSTIAGVVESAVGTVISIISGAVDVISGFVGAIGNALSAVGDFVGSVGGSVAGALGFAYGKDRVPYNNYPAILHEGEKVLTRNQADQYDRVINTRGVKLAPSIKDIEPDTGGTQPITPKQDKAETKQENKGSTITIERLADTVVIQKEADVDRVVQDMVTKFRKLVPNMP